MPTLPQQRTQKYIAARQQHPAWLLLASRRAPLMLSGLEALFEHQPGGVAFDTAVQALADLLGAHANQPEYEIEPADLLAQARRELREWIRRGLVTEREGRVHETDALKTAMRFVAQLDQRMMTSTASRLAVVQREIDNLAAALDPNPHSRAEHLQRRINDLQQQLEDVQAGRVPLLTEAQAVEGIREVYALATSLRADFRRVEDSWREADRALRQAILSAQHHRGAVMERLLGGHAALLNTQEGRVFESFQQQLDHQGELAEMRARPSDCAAAMARHGASAGAQAAASQQALAELLAQVDAGFHRLLLRRLALWQGTPIEQVATAARISLQLTPGCAQGRPLRALAVAGNDSKFFERHAALLTALLDERFDGEASRQGLTAFLGAQPEGEHWLLVAPLAPGLLPFARQRVPASELAATPLPASHLLLVENERCLHLLPQPLAGTIAILGAGLNLGWLAAPWLQERRVAYWGGIDTWGLQMLATARRHLPQITALLMDRATFDAHAAQAVAEPVRAESPPASSLRADERALDAHLRGLETGRLEQEFIAPAAVARAVRSWHGNG